MHVRTYTTRHVVLITLVQDCRRYGATAALVETREALVRVVNKPDLDNRSLWLCASFPVRVTDTVRVTERFVGDIQTFGTTQHSIYTVSTHTA